MMKVEIIEPHKDYICHQKEKSLIQDTYSYEDLSNKEFDFEKFSNCKHVCILPVGHNLSTIHGSIHNENMKNQIKVSLKRRGPRPKTNAIISQKLVCMFLRMHFLNRLDGARFLKYKMICAWVLEKG